MRTLCNVVVKLYTKTHLISTGHSERADQCARVELYTKARMISTCFIFRDFPCKNKKSDRQQTLPPVTQFFFHIVFNFRNHICKLTLTTGHPIGKNVFDFICLPKSSATALFKFMALILCSVTRAFCHCRSEPPHIPMVRCKTGAFAFFVP